MWRWIIIVVIVAIAGVIVTLSVTASDPVDAAPVVRGDISRYVEERARTRLPRTWSITMPLAGRVLPIVLVEGDTVDEGQVVARIDPVDLETAVTVADARVKRLTASIVENNDDRLERSGLEGLDNIIASIDRAVEASAAKTESSKAREDFFQTDYERRRTAFEGDAATQMEVDESRLSVIESRVDYRTDVLTLRALEAIRQAAGIWPIQVHQTIEKKMLSAAVIEQQLAEARATQAQAERDRRRTDIVSPIGGVVLRRAVSSERVLPAGRVLLEVGRLETLEVEVDVLSEDAVEITEGDPVDIIGAAIGPVACRGHVARIEPRGFTKVSSLGVEQQRVNVIVAFEPGMLETLENAGRQLGADYRVRCRIHTDRRRDALIIPRSALFRGAGDRWQAFAVRGGRARLADLEIGLMNDAEVEVISGLSTNELVILAPENDLADGTRVSVR